MHPSIGECICLETHDQKILNKTMFVLQFICVEMLVVNSHLTNAMLLLFVRFFYVQICQNKNKETKQIKTKQTKINNVSVL